MIPNVTINELKEYIISNEVQKYENSTKKNAEAILDIKKEIFCLLKEISKSYHTINDRYLIDNLFHGSFDEMLAYCFKFLEELGIPENEYKPIIIQAIKISVTRISVVTINSHADKLDNLLIRHISHFFSGGITLKYFNLSKYAKKFHLIYLDETCVWQISNIGNYFLRLKMMDALSFICVLSMITNNQSVSIEEKILILKKWLEDGEINDSESRRILGQEIVFGFGLFERLPNVNKETKINFDKITRLSIFGKITIDNIIKNFEKYFDIIQTLLEAEFLGDFVYYSPDLFTEAIDKFKSSELINDDFLSRLELSINHYKSGDYSAAYSLLIPQVEELVNIALKKISIDYSKARGLADKIELLENKCILSKNDSLNKLVRSVRNFVAHGEEIKDVQMFVPLYQLIIAYMVQEIDELSDYFLKKA